MRPSSRSLLLLASLLLLGCGGGGDAASYDEGAPAEEELADEAPPADEEQPADSIPMDVTVAITPGPRLTRSGSGPNTVFETGPFHSTEKGPICQRFPNATDDGMAPEWQVEWHGTDESIPIDLVRMNIGKTTGGSTDRFSTLVMAGRMKIAGMSSPIPIDISTYPGDMRRGSGTAKVQPTGKGVRIDLDAMSQDSVRVKVTVVCETLGSVI